MQMAATAAATTDGISVVICMTGRPSSASDGDGSGPDVGSVGVLCNHTGGSGMDASSGGRADVSDVDVSSGGCSGPSGTDASANGRTDVSGMDTSSAGRAGA